MIKLNVICFTIYIDYDFIMITVCIYVMKKELRFSYRHDGGIQRKYNANQYMHILYFYYTFNEMQNIPLKLC